MSIEFLKKKEEKRNNLIFYFSYGSFFGGECEFLIINNRNRKCRVLAQGYNGYDLTWDFEMPIEKLKQLERVIQPAKKWLRNYQLQQDIYDGYGWEIVFKKKDYKISSRGYMANPSNYFKVGKRIIKILNKFRKENCNDKSEKLLDLNGYGMASFF